MNVRNALTLLVLMAATAVQAADQYSITVKGRDGAVLTKPVVQLSDIADVSSPRIQDDEVILALGRIEISAAPSPGASISLTAHDIIGKIQGAGVKLSDIGYAFPRVITVRRASRMLTEEEVQQSIEEYVRREDAQATVRQINFPKNSPVAPDAKIVDVQPAAYSEGSQQRFMLRLAAANQPEQKITVSAGVDRWASVAVLRRSIQKGEVVDAGDVVMARLNLQNLPADTISDPSKIIGLETKRNLNAGEVLQKAKLDIPTVIRAGEKVTLRYHSALLEATATGTALDAAGLQQQIRVKNELSNKVVAGIVSAPGIVEVK